MSPGSVSSAPATTEADFEKQLSDLSASFVRVPVEEIDNEIERWLERVVLAMGVDRSTLLQIDPADGGLYTTHQWARPGLSTPDRGVRTNVAVSFPWLNGKVRAGEMVVFSRFEDLPPEAFDKDVAASRNSGTKSNVTVPIRIGDVVVGAVLFGAIITERDWSEKEIQRLKLVAGIFGNAFERQRVEAEIRRL